MFWSIDTCQTRSLLNSIRLRFRAHRGHINNFLVTNKKDIPITFLTERKIMYMKDHITTWVVKMKTLSAIKVLDGKTRTMYKDEFLESD